VYPFGLGCPCAARHTSGSGQPAGIGVVIFDIVGPRNAIAQLGKGFAVERGTLFVQQGFGAGWIIRLDQFLQFGAQRRCTRVAVRQITLGGAAKEREAAGARAFRQDRCAALAAIFSICSACGSQGASSSSACN
jgi:hypothetical protein